MRLLYTSDFHGSAGHFATFLTIAASTRPDVVVLGGDMLPDDSAIDPQTLGHGQPEFVRGSFHTFITQIRKCSPCKNVLLIYGNHDWGSCIPAMEGLAGEGLITILDHKHSEEIDGLSFIGYPCTPPTPWFVKDFERLDKPGDQIPLLGGAKWDPRFSRPIQHNAGLLFAEIQTIAEDLSTLIVPPDPWIFVAHAPPMDTKLDRNYGNKAGGSRAIREAIEQHQPLLTLHGHIHESPDVTGHWRDELGRSIAVNPGQGSKILHYVNIDIDVASKSITEMECGRSPVEEA